MIDPALIDRAKELIEKGETVLDTAMPEQSGPSRQGRITDGSFLDYALWSEWRNQSLSFLRKTLGDTDNYSVQFDERCNSRRVAPTNAGLGILRAVKQDLEGGRLARLPELVHADVFSDFLEMAEHLLGGGYQDAAAVLGGGVLEEHLRLLCKKHGIPTMTGAKPIKGDTMNAELSKSGVYNTNRQKIITALLGIRNSAAHGNYSEYTREQVANYLLGIREFINQFPA